MHSTVQSRRLVTRTCCCSEPLTTFWGGCELSGIEECTLTHRLTREIERRPGFKKLNTRLKFGFKCMSFEFIDLPPLT